MVWTLHLKGDVLDAQDLVDLPSQLVDDLLRAMDGRRPVHDHMGRCGVPAAAERPHVDVMDEVDVGVFAHERRELLGGHPRR